MATTSENDLEDIPTVSRIRATKNILYIYCDTIKCVKIKYAAFIAFQAIRTPGGPKVFFCISEPIEYIFRIDDPRVIHQMVSFFCDKNFKVNNSIYIFPSKIIKNIYYFMIDYIKKNELSPTLRQIVLGVSMKSSGTVHRNLEEMQRIGLVIATKPIGSIRRLAPIPEDQLPSLWAKVHK